MTIEEKAKNYVIEKHDVCLEGRIIPNLTEDKFHTICEESYIAGHKEAINSIDWKEIGKEFIEGTRDYHDDWDYVNFFKEQVEKQLK